MRKYLQNVPLKTQKRINSISREDFTGTNAQQTISKERLTISIKQSKGIPAMRLRMPD